MKKLLSIAAIFALSSSLISCTHTSPQMVHLKSKIEVEESKVGNSKMVNILVTDNRADKENIGKKHFGKEVVAIKSEQNLSEIVKEQITKGLEQKGFKAGKGKTLKVSIENLSYSSKRSFIGSTRAEAALKVSLKSKKTNFSKTYKIDLENDYFVVSTAKNDCKNVNKAVKTAVKTLLKDEELLKLLAE